MRGKKRIENKAWEEKDTKKGRRGKERGGGCEAKGEEETRAESFKE